MFVPTIVLVAATETIRNNFDSVDHVHILDVINFFENKAL